MNENTLENRITDSIEDYVRGQQTSKAVSMILFYTVLKCRQLGLATDELIDRFRNLENEMKQMARRCGLLFDHLSTHNTVTEASLKRMEHIRIMMDTAEQLGDCSQLLHIMDRTGSQEAGDIFEPPINAIVSNGGMYLQLLDTFTKSLSAASIEITTIQHLLKQLMDELEQMKEQVNLMLDRGVERSVPPTELYKLACLAKLMMFSRTALLEFYEGRRRTSGDDDVLRSIDFKHELMTLTSIA